MDSPEPRDTSPQTADFSHFRAGDARIDAPHSSLNRKAEPARRTTVPMGAVQELSGFAPPPPTDLDFDLGGYDSLVSPEALQTQAGQLAGYLRQQQQDIDHREAALNARSAQFESLVRRTKMMMIRRQSELDQREAGIADVEARVAQREQYIDAQIAEQEAALNDRAARIERGEREIEIMRQRHESVLEELTRREQDVAEQREAMADDEEKYRRMRDMERLLAEAQAETCRVREGLVRQRRQLEKECASERRVLGDEYARRMKEVTTEREALAKQHEQIDRSRAALEKARDELGRMHRETLEIRLATEELWLQLSDTAPPEALSQSLGQIRAHLADQYRSALSRVEERKAELETVRDQLVAQHDAVVSRKSEVEKWTAQHESKLSEREASLAQRESELERREATFDALAKQWFEKRREEAGE